MQTKKHNLHNDVCGKTSVFQSKSVNTVNYAVQRSFLLRKVQPGNEFWTTEAVLEHAVWHCYMWD